MATKVGEGYVGITADAKGLQGSLAGIGSMLGGKMGTLGSVLGGQLGNSMGQGLQKNTAGVSSGLGGITQALGKGGVWGIAAAAAVGVGAALYKMGSDFGQANRTIARETGATGSNLGALEQSFKNVAKSTPASFQQVTQAIIGVQRYTGPTGAGLENLSHQFLTLSRITGTDVKTNVESGVTALHNWNVAQRDAPKSMDALFTASQRSGVGFATLAGQVTQFGPQMRTMGYNFNQSVAVLGTFGKTGANTARIMAGLQLGASNIAASQPKATAAIQKAQAEVDKYQTALSRAKPGSTAFQNATDSLAAAHLKLSAAQQNAAGAGRSIPQALNDSIKSIKEAGNRQDALNLAIGVFGKRAAPQMVDAIRSGKFNFDEMKKAIDKSHGSIEETGKRTQTLGGAFGKLKNQVEVALAPASEAMFKGINRGLIETMNYLPNLARTLNEAFKDAYSFVSQWTRRIYEAITPLRQGIGATFTTIARLMFDAWHVVEPIFKLFIDGFKLIWDILHGDWGAAGRALWDMVKDIGRALAGIPKLIFDYLTAPFASLGPTIANALGSFWSEVSAIPGKIISFLAGVGGAVWGAISGGFAQAVGGAEAGISGLWGWVTGIAGRVLQAFANLGGAVWGAISGGFGQAVGAAEAGIGGIWGWVGGVIGRIAGGLAALGGAVWGAISGGFGQAVAGAEAGISGLWGWVGGVPGRIKNALGDVASLLYDAGTAIINSLGRGIKEAAQGVFDFVSGIGDKIKNLKGPLDYDKKLLIPAGLAIMGGLHESLKQGMDEVSQTVTAFTTGLASTPGTPIPMTLGGAGPAGGGYGGPAVVIQNATFTDQADIDQFMRQAAWVVQTQRI